eukprot:gene9901-20594_t
MSTSSNRTIEEIYETFGGNDEEKLDVIQMPNRDTKRDFEFQENQSVDLGNIDAGLAFEVFQGRIFSVPKQQSSNRSEYSIADSVEKRVESPLQRFTRLRSELSELCDDLNSMTTNENQPTDSTIWSSLLEETKQLQNNIKTIESHKKLQENTNGNGNTSDSSISNKLTIVSNQLQDHQKSSTSTSTSTLVLESKDSLSVSSIAVLEQRVFALETLLGSASNALDMEAIVGVTPRSSIFPLVQTVSKLEKRISLLDESTMETIRNKASGLRMELDAVSREKGKLPASEQKAMESSKKISDLYDK